MIRFMWWFSWVISNISFCKVGVTRTSVMQRFSGKCEIHDCHTINLPLYEAWRLEQHLLLKFRNARFKYKKLANIEFAGWTECFSLKIKDDIQREINRYVIQVEV